MLATVVGDGERAIAAAHRWLSHVEPNSRPRCSRANYHAQSNAWEDTESSTYIRIFLYFLSAQAENGSGAARLHDFFFFFLP